MKGYWIALMCLCSTAVLAQADEGDRKLLSYSVVVAGGQGIFASTPSGPSKFPAPEFRLGGGTSYRLSELFDLELRLLFGVRRKREPMNVPGQPYRVTPPFMDLDEVASSRDHYFYELPLTVNFDIPHPGIGLRAGMSYRHFFPNNDAVDWLTARGEVGLTGGGYVRLHRRVRLGAEQYFGITKVYTAQGLIDGRNTEVDVRNRYLQIYVQYNF